MKQALLDLVAELEPSLLIGGAALFFTVSHNAVSIMISGFAHKKTSWFSCWKTMGLKWILKAQLWL